MFRKLFKGILKLSIYSAVLLILAGVWDYTQKRQAAEDDFTVADYATSVSERYGPHMAQLADFAEQTAGTGFAAGVEWATSAGVLEQFGGAPAIEEATAQAASDPQQVETPNDLVVLASVNTVAAPETSLFPRARVLQ